MSQGADIKSNIMILPNCRIFLSFFYSIPGMIDSRCNYHIERHFRIIRREFQDISAKGIGLENICTGLNIITVHLLNDIAVGNIPCLRKLTGLKPHRLKYGAAPAFKVGEALPYFFHYHYGFYIIFFVSSHLSCPFSSYFAGSHLSYPYLSVSAVLHPYPFFPGLSLMPITAVTDFSGAIIMVSIRVIPACFAGFKTEKIPRWFASSKSP